MSNFLELTTIFFEKNSIKIILIVVLFIIAKFLLKAIIAKIVGIFEDDDKTTKSRMEKRADTLGSVVLAIGNTVIYTIILLMVLGLFELNIAPILAGAGILGLAIGFGAQAIVKDFVSGLFILIEDQYNVGDEIKIGVFSGRVEDLTLRSTVLRDGEGKVCYIQNGSINNVINLSKKDV